MAEKKKKGNGEDEENVEDEQNIEEENPDD